MNASSVQIIGVKLQVSRPVWCPHPPRRPASKWTSSDEAQSLFEQMSLCPKLIHSQADSFTSEFYPSRGSCGYALLLSSGNVPVTGALPDPPPSRKQVDLQ